MERKRKILIVDDEFRFLHTLSKRLSFRDYDVTPVTSGQQAIQYARDTEFDLAIVDLKMPGMPGEEVLDKLKAEHPSMEVVILTGHGSFQSAIKCVRSGSVYYLQKPCVIEELLTVLENAYEKRIKRKRASGESVLKNLPGTPNC